MTNSGQLCVVSLLVVLIFIQKYDVASSAKMDRDATNFCFRKSSAAHGARYSFLRESAGVHAAGPLQLYQSTWTEEPRLLECLLSDHASVTASYLSLCRGDLADEFTDEVDGRFNISQLLVPGSPCARVPAEEPLVALSPAAPTLRRHKRSWIFPGTLWCGTGSKAIDYGDLGVFNQTDQCCREHDHCEHTITPFKVNFGVFNHHFFTVSHCNCDRRFRQCLLGVNDTVSHMVGFSFFSVLKVPCFRLTMKPYCTQLSWWGACKQTQVAPFAVFRSPALYDSMHLPRRHGRVGVPLVTAAPAGFQNTTCSPTAVMQSTSHTSTKANQSLGLRPKPSKSISPPTTRVDSLTRPREKPSKNKNTPPTKARNSQTGGPRPKPSKNISTTISPMINFETNTEDSKYALATKPSTGQSEGPMLKLPKNILPTSRPRQTSGPKKKPSKCTPPTKRSQILRGKQLKKISPGRNRASQLAGSKEKPSKKMSLAGTTTSQLISPRIEIPKNCQTIKNSTSKSARSRAKNPKNIPPTTTATVQSTCSMTKPPKSTVPTTTTSSQSTRFRAKHPKNIPPTTTTTSQSTRSWTKYPKNIPPTATSHSTHSRTKPPENTAPITTTSSQSTRFRAKHPKNIPPTAASHLTCSRTKHPKKIPPTTTTTSQSTHYRAKNPKNIPPTTTTTSQSTHSRTKHPKNISPTATNQSKPTSQSTNSKVKNSKRPVGCGRREPPRGDNYRGPGRKGKGSGSSRRKNACMKLSGSQGPTHRSTAVIGPTSLPGIHSLLGSADGLTVSQPRTPSEASSEMHSAEIRPKDRLQLVKYYRPLEECRYKILPQERQYLLFNREAKVLYHCNCIRRLYRELRRIRYPMDIHMSLLLGSLSPSCFVFKDCPERSLHRCPASLSQVEKLMLTLDMKKHKQGKKSLEEAALTVKKDKTRKSLGKSASFRSHRKCLRVTDFNE